MNAELLGIITVAIVLLGAGVVIIAQSNEFQLTPQIEEPKTIGPFTSSTQTDTHPCEIIPALCR